MADRGSVGKRPSGARARRRVTWKRLDARGREEAVLFPYKRTWHIRGRADTDFDGSPATVRYEISCKENWEFSLGWVSMRWKGATTRLGVVHTIRRGWTVSGTPRPDLAGCVDLDLSITPSTNTLPIRRLGLEVGDGLEVTAAWVRFPELRVEPLRQRYTRLDATRYRYESLDSGYSAVLETDADGLVVAYPGLWARA